MKASFSFALALCLSLTAVAQDRLLVENIGPDDVAMLVQNGKIAWLGSPDGRSDIGDVERIDAGGKVALPGLIDMHVHVWGEAELAAYLASGVTTVRNLSGMPFHLRMADAIEAGELEGPHLFTSGPILNSPGPNQQINHQLVASEEDGRSAVRSQAEAGFRRVKTYSNLSVDAWRGILAEARAQGMAITGHTPEGERLEGIPHDRPFELPFADILGAGWETIEHTESIYFHALRDSWDPVAARNIASALAASRNPVTPTLVAQRNLVHVAETQGAFARRPGTEWLNPVTQAVEAEAIAFWSAHDPADERERAVHYAQFTRMMQDQGVLLVAGSDAGISANVPGVSLLDELDLLVEAGLSNQEAIAAATSNAAMVLGEEGRLGCLEAGCDADVVFYACDPLEAVTCLRSPAALMRGGRWYDGQGLANLRARAAQHDVDQIVTDIVAGMEAQGTLLNPVMLGL